MGLICSVVFRWFNSNSIELGEDFSANHHATQPNTTQPNSTAQKC